MATSPRNDSDVFSPAPSVPKYVTWIKVGWTRENERRLAKGSCGNVLRQSEHQGVEELDPFLQIVSGISRL